MRRFTLLIFLFAAVNSCKKETETINPDTAGNYYPLQTGKRTVYRLDSTIYLDFGSTASTVSHLIKDSIINTFTDNTGRTSYTVYRYITDTLQTQPWAYKSAYYITSTKSTIEVMDENNLRFIKLTMPIADGNTWKGNAYIDTKSETSELQYMNGWDYTYQDVAAPYTVLIGTIDSTVTILQEDETIPEGDFDPQYYKQRNYSVEVYGKGIGLVYKEFSHWTWQPPASPIAGHYEDGSYGIKLSLVDHN